MCFKLLLKTEKWVTCFRNEKKKTKNKIGGRHFVSELKRVVNYPDVERLAHVIQSLQRLIFRVKNIEGKSMEANDLSYIVHVEVGLLHK